MAKHAEGCAPLVYFLQKVSEFWKKRILMPELCKTILAFDIFEKWEIDVIGPFPITNRGKSYILRVVDYLSRWTEAAPMR